MNRRKLLVVLLCLLGFAIAAGLRHAFGDSTRPYGRISIDPREGMPYWKIERLPDKSAPKK